MTVQQLPRRIERKRTDRRITQRGCSESLTIAPLWVAYVANLGTLMRTCDAIAGCISVPATPHYRKALATGDTLRARRPHIHWVNSRERWVEAQRQREFRIVAVELTEGATRLPDLQPARSPVVILLGHESDGVPAWAVEIADECVEIPMVGRGASLNVAVAGSLVAYRLAGLS